MSTRTYFSAFVDIDINTTIRYDYEHTDILDLEPEADKLPHICVYIYACTYVYVCMYVCMYVCIYVCM